MSGTKQSGTRDQLQATRERAKQRAQATAQLKADEAKEEFGRLAFDTLEEYFPEQAKARRRQDRLQFIMVGVAVGFLLRHLLSQGS